MMLSIYFIMIRYSFKKLNGDEEYLQVDDKIHLKVKLMNDVDSYSSKV